MILGGGDIVGNQETIKELTVALLIKSERLEPLEMVELRLKNKIAELDREIKNKEESCKNYLSGYLPVDLYNELDVLRGQLKILEEILGEE